jgi:hypothetical protein
VTILFVLIVIALSSNWGKLSVKRILAQRTMF